jgi:predicted GTPase
VKDIIKNKDVILIIGNTGSGKTTTTLKLLGCNFKRKEGTKSWVPDGGCNSNYESFRISNKARSETSIINAALIPKEMKSKLLDQKAIDEELFLCDTPGFEDTKRSEHDIANQKGVFNAIKRCNSVRVIVLIPNSVMDMNNCRMEGIRTIAKTICQLCPLYL